jgi:hypothetical protein
MPSLKDLFRTQPLPTQNNKVGAEVYNIRNSKDIPINTANGILNATVFPIVQKTLRSSGLLTARTKENLVESELVGLRAIRGLSSPVIYGTSLIRFTRKTTNAVEVMKNATAGGSEGSNFVLGSTVAKLQGKALELASKIGIQFPENLIPTKVSEKPAFANKKVTDTMVILKDLKEGSEGNLVGKLLASTAQGTPNQIGRQVIGTAISLARDEIRRRLTSSFTLPSAPSIGNVGNSVVEQTIRLRDSPAKPYDNGNDRYSIKVSRRGSVEFDGLSGILSGFYRFPNDATYKNFIESKKQFDASNFADPIKAAIPEKGGLGAAGAFFQDPGRAIGDVVGNAVSNVGTPINITNNIPARPTAKRYSGVGTRGRNNSLEGKFKIRNGSDRLNQSATWTPDPLTELNSSDFPSPPKDFTGKTLDDFDLIPFRFYSISKNTGVSFRATISGLSETVSPSWNSSKFVGNPYNFYTYEGVERSVSFTFKLYALNGEELKRMWEKLSFLNTFAYPQQYAAPYVTPPFMKFTLGNMYKNKEGFVESLTISIDDNTPWETGIPHINSSGLPYFNDALVDYKLPTIIEVQMTIKFVESQSTYWDGNTPKRVYYYGVNRSIQTKSEIDGNMLPDGSSAGVLAGLPLPDPRAELLDEGLNTDVLNNTKRQLMTKDAILELPTGGISGIKQPLQIQQQAAQKAGGNILKKLFGKK